MAVQALLEGRVHVALRWEELVQDLDLSSTAYQSRELVLDRFRPIERQALGFHVLWDGGQEALLVRVANYRYAGARSGRGLEAEALGDRPAT